MCCACPVGLNLFIVSCSSLNCLCESRYSCGPRRPRPQQHQPRNPTGEPAVALPGRNVTRLAIREMETAVDFYFGFGVAQSTHRTYVSDQQHYLRFCQHIGFQPILVLVNQLMLFTMYLALRGLKWKTIEIYVSIGSAPTSTWPRV